MFKFVLTVLCAVAFVGLGFSVANSFGADKPAPVVKANPNEGIGCPACGARPDDDEMVVLAVSTTATAPATAPATQKAAVDVKNTKCIVTEEDVGTETIEYNGKTYHICCGDCKAEFKKDPEKYVKAITADPAKYGVPK